jgi:hypothetical protein
MRPVVNITLTSGCSFAWQNAKLWQDANRRAAIFAQFWSKVQRADAKTCWIFSDGPTFTVDEFQIPLAEFVWFAARGREARGLFRQRCGNAQCVNPSHLERGCRVCGVTLNRKQKAACSHQCSGVLTLPRDQRGEKNGNFKGWRSKQHSVYSRAFKRLNPEKNRAHGIVRYAIRRGLLVRPCQRARPVTGRVAPTHTMTITASRWRLRGCAGVAIVRAIWRVLDGAPAAFAVVASLGCSQ